MRAPRPAPAPASAPACVGGGKGGRGDSTPFMRAGDCWPICEHEGIADNATCVLCSAKLGSLAPAVTSVRQCFACTTGGGQLDTISNGVCNDQNNNAECNYDGGEFVYLLMTY